MVDRTAGDELSVLVHRVGSGRQGLVERLQCQAAARADSHDFLGCGPHNRGQVVDE